jgi:hypothetical protein
MMNEHKIQDLLPKLGEQSNSVLIEMMDFLQNDFDVTKQRIVDLTYHLDTIETIYDKINKEYSKRNP